MGKKIKGLKYRAAGIALKGNQVLVYQNAGSHYWSLPGGRVERYETSSEALMREVLEETGVEVVVGRLVWVVEQFYEYFGKPIHELAMYYLISLPSDSGLYRNAITEGFEKDRPLTFQWHDLDAPGGITLFPSFLTRSLRAIPESIEHFVIRETDIPY